MEELIDHILAAVTVVVVVVVVAAAVANEFQKKTKGEQEGQQVQA